MLINMICFLRKSYCPVVTYNKEWKEQEWVGSVFDRDSYFFWITNRSFQINTSHIVSFNRSIHPSKSTAFKQKSRIKLWLWLTFALDVPEKAENFSKYCWKTCREISLFIKLRQSWEFINYLTLIMEAYCAFKLTETQGAIKPRKKYRSAFLVNLFQALEV